VRLEGEKRNIGTRVPMPWICLAVSFTKPSPSTGHRLVKLEHGSRNNWTSLGKIPEPSPGSVTTCITITGTIRGGTGRKPEVVNAAECSTWYGDTDGEWNIIYCTSRRTVTKDARSGRHSLEISGTLSGSGRVGTSSSTTGNTLVDNTTSFVATVAALTATNKKEKKRAAQNKGGFKIQDTFTGFIRKKDKSEAPLPEIVQIDIKKAEGTSSEYARKFETMVIIAIGKYHEFIKLNHEIILPLEEESSGKKKKEKPEDEDVQGKMKTNQNLKNSLLNSTKEIEKLFIEFIRTFPDDSPAGSSEESAQKISNKKSIILIIR